MARVIGIDLGAHSVKVAALEVGLRAVRVESVQTLEVLAGPGSSLQRSSAALAALEAIDESDGVTVALPGDRLLLRMLDIPFADPRKLQAVVGNELADEMPWEVEDVVFDHLALRPPINKVLAAAARSSEVQELLAGLEARGIVPRHLAVAPLGYGELVRRLYPATALAVVDVGHLRTNVCLVLNGRALTARTLSRGGHQLTEALRQVYQLSYAQASELKETRAVAAAEPERLAGEERELAEVTARALAPLAREVQLTLAVQGSQLGVRPKGILLCGGGALLRGLDGYLGAQVGLPVRRLTFAGDGALEAAGLGEDGEAISALSMGLALEHVRRPPLELRQGQFAFEVDQSLLRDKLLHLTAAALAVLMFAGLSAYASLASLRGEEARLEQRLAAESRRVFGKPLSAEQVARELKRGTGAVFSVPDKTATDVLDLLSRHLPGKTEAKIDVTRLDIKPGKVYLKGTADSQSTVGQMVKALKAQECFKEVSSGKISAVGDGQRQFTLNIVTTCF